MDQRKRRAASPGRDPRRLRNGHLGDDTLCDMSDQGLYTHARAAPSLSHMYPFHPAIHPCTHLNTDMTRLGAPRRTVERRDATRRAATRLWAPQRVSEHRDASWSAATRRAACCSVRRGARCIVRGDAGANGRGKEAGGVHLSREPSRESCLCRLRRRAHVHALCAYTYNFWTL